MKKFKDHIKQETDITKELVRLLRRMERNHIALDSLGQSVIRVENLYTFAVLKRQLMYVARLALRYEEMLENLDYHFNSDRWNYSNLYANLKEAADKAIAGDVLTYDEINKVTNTDEAFDLYQKYEINFRVALK